MTWRLRAQALISPGGLRVRLSSLPAGTGAPGTHFPVPCAPRPNNNGASRCATALPPPPRHTRAHTHRHGGISCPPAPPRGLGAVNSLAGLVTGHPGTAAQSGPAGKARRTVRRRPGEALTQPNPTPPTDPNEAPVQHPPPPPPYKETLHPVEFGSLSTCEASYKKTILSSSRECQDSFKPSRLSVIQISSLHQFLIAQPPPSAFHLQDTRSSLPSVARLCHRSR